MNTSIRKYLGRFVIASAVIAAILLLLTSTIQSSNFQALPPRAQSILLILYKNQVAFVLCYIGISAFALTMISDGETNFSVSSNKQVDKYASSSNNIDTKASLENAFLQDKEGVKCNI